LEVRCTAYLRGVHAWAELGTERADLHVSGTVEGFSDGPLDLYVILDRSPLLEAQITTAPGGQPFRVTATGLSPERLSQRTEAGGEACMVQVDLVNGAVVWYTSIEPLSFTAIGREG
jgi:hypothetical protein